MIQEDQTNAQAISADRMQRQDHDLLIRLEGKVDNITSNVQELKDGVIPRLVVLEKDMADVLLWKHDFSLGYKFTVALVGFLGSVIGFIISLVVKLYVK